jgi:RNA polymerase subunit RPABC4/transcription elongation factor Spt4
MAKTRYCKNCNTELVGKSNVCPTCGAVNKKPIYKRVWFWILILIVICGIGLSGGDDTDSADSGASNDVTSNEVVETAGDENSEDEAVEKEEENVPLEYRNALAKAQIYAETMSMSKKAVYEQLVSEYGENFEEDAAQYAIDNLEGISWKKNALEKAKTYSETMNMSKAAIYDQLISEYGEQFTKKQAQYAIDHLE